MSILKEQLQRIKSILKYELGKTLSEQEGSNPKNPNAYPDQDEWGPDDSWSWDEWKIYFDSMKNYFGVIESKKRFLKYWEVVENGTFVKADNEMEPKWFKDRKMWNESENRPYTQDEYVKTLPKIEPFLKPKSVSDKLVEFVKKEEFFVPCVYDDKKSIPCLRNDMKKCCMRGRKPVGVPTIGYGTVYYPNGKKVRPNDPDISVDTATQYLKNKLNKISSKLLLLHPNLNQNQLDALSSLCYNVGFSGCTTKAPKLNKSIQVNPDSTKNEEIGKNFLDFDNKNRREKEFLIYHKGHYEIS